LAIELTPGPGAYSILGDDLKRPCSAKYSPIYQESARDSAPISEPATRQAPGNTTPTTPTTTSSHTPKNRGRRNWEAAIQAQAVTYSLLRIRDPTDRPQRTALPHRSQCVQVLRM